MSSWPVSFTFTSYLTNHCTIALRPIAPSINHSLFHSRLKTYLLHKSFPSEPAGSAQWIISPSRCQQKWRQTARRRWRPLSAPTSNYLFLVSTSSPTPPNKKLSCHRETVRCFVSFNISLSHSRSCEMSPLSMACVKPDQYSIITMSVSRTVSEIFSIK